MSELTESQQPRGGKLLSVVTSEIFIMVSIYLGTLLLHILMMLCTTIFNLTPDEYSVTAVAALANGLDWSSTVSTGGYYGYFQSIFYIPIFAITDEPYLRYHLMLLVNGMLMSFAPVIIYWLSRRAFEVKKGAAVLFSLLCGWYPCYMLLSKYTWNETMCNLLPWVFALLIYKSLAAQKELVKQVYSVLAGLVLVAAYATHGRMLALLATGVVLQLVVYFSMKRTRIFCMTGFFASVAAGFVCDKLIKRRLQSILWNVDEGKTPINTIEKMFDKLITVNDAGGISLNENLSLDKFLDTLVGHFFYFISSTWGFGAVCVVVIITAIVLFYKHRGREVKLDENGVQLPDSGPYINKNTAVMCWYAFLAMGAAFVVSVAFKATSSLIFERMDTVIYGRYTESFYPLAIFAGMLLIYKGRLGLGQSFAALIFGAAVNLLSEMLVVPVVLGGDRLVSAMIMGIAPLRYGEGMRDLFTSASFIKIIITTMSVLFVWVIIKLIRRDDKRLYMFFALPLAGMLMYTNIYCYNNYTVPQSKNAQNGADYMTAAIELLDGEFDSVTCVNIAKERYVKAQFLYPELDFKIISSVNKFRTLEEMPDIILASREDNISLCSEDIWLIGDINSNVQVYAGTERAHEWALSKGYHVTQGGAIRYSAADIPATTSVVKDSAEQSANLAMESAYSDEVRAVIPQHASVYTNYFNPPYAGRYLLTITGDNLEGSKLSITAAKGETDLNFEVISETETELAVTFFAREKTANVRCKLTNGEGEPVIVRTLTVEKAVEE